MEFLTLKPEAFGLDISDLSLKIAKLKQKGKFFDLVSFGEEKIKPGIIEGGEIRDEVKLSEAIKEAMKKVKGEKIKTKYVIVSLPEEKSFLRVIQMPRMAEEDLKSAVIYEAENYIPLPIEQVYLDSQIIPPIHKDSGYFDVLIAAIPKKIVDSYVFSLKKAGLQPRALEIESLAISRALIKDEVTTSAVLLIDFGKTRTNIIIFSNSSLRLTSSIFVSSGSFDEIIAKNLGISLSEAERLKIKYGLEGKIKEEKKETNKEGGEFFEILVPALIDLVQQIKKYIDYYQTHILHGSLSSFNFQKKDSAKQNTPTTTGEISKILLCGGGANLKGLTELLTLELKIPVELGNPWVNILPEGQKEAPNLSFEQSLSYTTAIGLALRGIKKHD